MTAAELWERALEGWLVIVRHQIDAEDKFTVMDLPSCVKAGWVERGWAVEVEDDDTGEVSLALTEQGHVASDLAAAEWGIDPFGSD